MFSKIEFYEQQTPKQLDQYLANGWYRSGKNIFTTNFLKFDNTFYSAIWYRLNLQNGNNLLPILDKKLAKTKSFKVTFEKFEYDSEAESLFQKYRTSRPFETAKSLFELLDVPHAQYNTQAVKIYDYNRLIGIGIADLGLNTMAGIVCFFDPNYQKYSLGKTLMYLKIKQCIKMGLTHFYPGYFAPGYKSFDYKLELLPQIGEFLDLKTNTWLAQSSIQNQTWPLAKMEQKLNDFCFELFANQIHRKAIYYEFYYCNMVTNYVGMGFYQYPIFVHLKGENIQQVVHYNPVNEQYEVANLVLEFYSNLNTNQPNLYAYGVLKQVSTLFTFTDPVQFIEKIEKKSIQSSEL